MDPDEELASLIADRLIEQRLIDPSRRDDVSNRIATGSATAEDWQLWIELSRIGRGKGVDDAED